MAWGRHDLEPKTVNVDNFAIDQRLRVGTERWVECADRRTGDLDETPDAFGVIEVPMRDQHESDIACRRRNRLQVQFVRWAGIDDDRALGSRFAKDPGVRTVERHDPRIRCDHRPRAFGDRTTMPLVHSPNSARRNGFPSTRTSSGSIGRIRRCGATVSASPASVNATRSSIVLKVGGNIAIELSLTPLRMARRLIHTPSSASPGISPTRLSLIHISEP